MVILGHNLGNSQVSVYRTIGPTLVISIYIEDRNVIARFDETLDIKETVYTKAIKNYKGK